MDAAPNLGEFRLLLEELCCDLCRFEHVTRDGLAPEAIRIDREYWLGMPGAFADIRVAPSGHTPYFVEVKYGYLHVGIAMGDLQIVSLRPFSRLHIGAIGDCINVASRLLTLAGPGEVVLSNAFHQKLDERSQARCSEIEPLDARNVGRIRAWKVGAPAVGV